MRFEPGSFPLTMSNILQPTRHCIHPVKGKGRYLLTLSTSSTHAICWGINLIKAYIHEVAILLAFYWSSYSFIRVFYLLFHVLLYFFLPNLLRKWLTFTFDTHLIHVFSFWCNFYVHNYTAFIHDALVGTLHQALVLEAVTLPYITVFNARHKHAWNNWGKYSITSSLPFPILGLIQNMVLPLWEKSSAGIFHEGWQDSLCLKYKQMLIYL